MEKWAVFLDNPALSGGYPCPNGYPFVWNEKLIRGRFQQKIKRHPVPCIKRLSFGVAFLISLSYCLRGLLGLINEKTKPVEFTLEIKRGGCFCNFFIVLPPGASGFY